MKLSYLNLLLCVCLFHTPWSATAQTGAYTHDRLFLSFSAGIAGGSIKSTVEDLDNVALTIYGTAFATDFRFGYSLTEHVSFQGGLVYVNLKDPKVAMGGSSSGEEAEGLTANEYMFGIGPLWNINRFDTWVSLLAGAGYVAVKDRDRDKSTTSDAGLGFQLKAGKDFWVSPGMTLGVGAMYMKSYIWNTESVSKEILNSNRFAFMLVIGFD